MFQDINIQMTILENEISRIRDQNLLVRHAAIRNCIVFGRALTNILQNLRHKTDPDFDVWYAKYQTEMRNDELMKRLYVMRSEILKEGQLRIGHTVSSFWTDEEGRPLGMNAPPGAKSFFLGDKLGGSGWEIQQPDGSVEKFYIELPLEVGHSIVIGGRKIEHRGVTHDRLDISDALELYFSYLKDMIADCKKQLKSKR